MSKRRTFLVKLSFLQSSQSSNVKSIIVDESDMRYGKTSV